MLEIFFERTLNFLLFWGIWLLAPLLVDVSTAVVYFLSLFVYSKKNKVNADLDFYPFVTIVIPVYNSAQTLYKCLKSIAEQSYPVQLIQVVCVNNGSRDNSFEVFQEFQQRRQDMALMWVSMDRPGKSMALNSGLYSGQGVYLINLDSDTWLDKNAILNVVRAFERDSSLVAATASIRVDKVLGKGFGFVDIINYCEVIEYLIAFDVGRRYQTMTNTLFTLSGAFSAFRREVILESFLYQERTVSEDTDLTFHIRNMVKNKRGRIACLSNAIAYVEPIESAARLYSQRVRWQRGEIEVVATHSKKIPGAWKALFNFTSRVLISDHTLAFSRLSWTFLIPFLYFLGYSISLVLVSFLGLFVCYLLLDGSYFLVAYKSVDKDFRKELKKIWWIVFFLPVYRYFSYWFRLSGIILGVTEKKSWKVENPVIQLSDVVKEYKKGIAKTMSLLKASLRFRNDRKD